MCIYRYRYYYLCKHAFINHIILLTFGGFLHPLVKWPCFTLPEPCWFWPPRVGLTEVLHLRQKSCWRTTHQTQQTALDKKDFKKNAKICKVSTLFVSTSWTKRRRHGIHNGFLRVIWGHEGLCPTRRHPQTWAAQLPRQNLVQIWLPELPASHANCSQNHRLGNCWKLLGSWCRWVPW